MPIGGAERQALKLARRLIEKGIAVTVVTGQWDWGQPRRENVAGVPVHRHFTGWSLFNVRGLGRFSQYLYLMTLFLYLVGHRREYDFIHCHSAMFEASVVVLAGSLLHKKTSARAMASGPWGDVKRLREGEGGSIWGTRWMVDQLRKADCIVALNKQVDDELIQIGVPPERIVHIPNGVETDGIRPKTDYGLGREVTVTFVGRLHPQKGIGVLLSAFKKVREALPQFSWQLKLIGEGSRRSLYEEMAGQLSIRQAVEFLGQVDDPFPYLDQSDIFVLPSRSEGISNALLEAMAHGLPCIVTDIPGNSDVVQHGKNGLLVRLDDDGELAAALTSLALDQGLRERLGQAAFGTVEERYSLDSVADQYAALYADLLQGDTRGAP
jgi:glycosyltransferase involved in cell wall biosynthesis